jgi:hypothetical protein
MQWKFWKLGAKKKDADESALEALRAGGNAALGWPANAGPQEILGLQKLVGNQAVLRMLAKNPPGASVKKQGH